MKFQKLYKIKYLAIIFVLFSIQFVNAQGEEPTPFDDNVTDVQGSPVPIDSWVLPVLLIGLVLSFLFFKKHKKEVIK